MFLNSPQKPSRTNQVCADTQFKMKHLAAYLLLGLAGNTEPSADDIKGVLSSVGIDADDDRLEKLIDELKGKDINEVGRISHLYTSRWERLTL